MEKDIYREESLKRISSPDQLNQYLKVTTPSVWLLLIAVAILGVAMLVWSSQAEIESYVTGNGRVLDGQLTVTFEDTKYAEYVKTDMMAVIGERETPILSVGRDMEGRVIAVAQAALPDGVYEVKVGYKQTKLLSLLFN